MKNSIARAARKGLFAIILSLASLHYVAGQPALTNAPSAPGNSGSDYVPGEVLVKFRGNVTDAEIAQAFRGASLRMVKQIQTPAMRQRGDIGITRALTAMPVEQALALLKQLPGIEYAEPNWVYTHQATTSNDPYFTGGSLWGMYGNLSSPANQYGSQAAEAWAPGHIGSQSVVVGIIDEGVQITHPDLAANVWSNLLEPLDGLDNDGNGYVDDVHGWDFFENNNSVYDSTADDHGTHVAGTIGATGGNNLGVVGVNWSVTMIPAKFLGPNGGNTADAVEAVDYFTALKYHGVNIVALNNSWGGGGYSQALHDAIIRAAKAGILFVAAAGNGHSITGKALNNDATPYYPACYNTAVGTSTESAAAYDAVIAVTAIDSTGKKGSFANYGAATVDLGAPGVNIISTLPGGYGPKTGTSMATPHVTGAIALYASTHPDASALDIRNAILTTVVPTSSLDGKTVTGGRLDLSSVITPPAPPSSAPVAPANLAGIAVSHAQIQLTWADNSNNESRFEITRTTVEGSETGVTLTVGANSTGFLDSGLSPSTTYIYTIKACNSVGCSSAVAAGEVTTLPGPAAATADYLGIDTATKGSWLGKYGADGYDILQYKKAPSYGTLAVSGYTPHIWSSSSSDARALQTPSGSSRFAACYYSFDKEGGQNAFYCDVNVTDGQKHRVSLYCLDWDRQARQQTIEVVDRNYGTLIDSRYVDSFGDGKYLSWDITGPVIIKVKWVDNTSSAGDNAAVSGIFLDSDPDARPTVSITAPVNNTVVSGMVTITGTATDDVGVSQVKVLVDGVARGTAALANNQWSIGWDTSSDTEGVHSITAEATDTVGQVTTSAGINVIVDNIDNLPTVSITSPTSGSTVSGTVSITAAAGDDRGVRQVEFLVNGSSVGTDTVGTDGWSVSWDTTSVLDASYSLTAVVTDTAYQITESSPVIVTVANTTPTPVHCGDLDATTTSSGNTWRATVTVTIHDANHAPVSGARVSGTWSGGYSGSVSGTTVGGQISFTTGSIPKNKSTVTFTVDNVIAPNLTYTAEINHDPDGDSNGTAIIVTKP